MKKSQTNQQLIALCLLLYKEIPETNILFSSDLTALVILISTFNLLNKL